MSASQPNAGERVRDVRVTEDTLAVDLADGRTIIVSLNVVSATLERDHGTAFSLESQWGRLWHPLAGCR